MIFEGEYYFGKRKKGKKYDIEGNLKFEGEYLEGKKWKGKQYEKGKLIFEGEFKDGKKWSGKIKEYDYDDELKFEGEYLYGKKHGFGKEYYNGKIKFEGEYHYGKKWKGKKYIFGYSNLELEGEYEYLFGKKNGKAIEYFENGKISFEGEYLNNSEWNGKYYNSNGDLIYETKNGKVIEQKCDLKGEPPKLTRAKKFSVQLPLLLCNFEPGNEEQKNYCLKLVKNYSHEKVVKYEIKCLENSIFSIMLILKGNVYYIQNTFDENEMVLTLYKIYTILDEED